MKMSIRKKLSLSFAAILFLLVASTAITLILSNIAKTTSTEISEKQFPSVKQLDKMTILLYKKRIVYDQYFLKKSRKHKDEIAKIEQEYNDLFSQYDKNVSPDEKAKLEKLKPLMVEYNKKFDATLDFMKKYPDNLAGIMRQIAIADDHFEQKIMPLFNEIHALKAKETNNLVEKLKTDLSNSNLITIGVGLLAVIIGIILATVLGKGISKPVVELTKAADEISLGKFETKINVKTQDEINELAKAIDRMRLSLKKAMERLTKK